VVVSLKNSDMSASIPETGKLSFYFLSSSSSSSSSVASSSSSSGDISRYERGLPLSQYSTSGVYKLRRQNVACAGVAARVKYRGHIFSAYILSLSIVYSPARCDTQLREMDGGGDRRRYTNDNARLSLFDKKSLSFLAPRRATSG